MQRPSRRTVIWGGVALLIVLLLAFALRPQPVLVDSAEVRRGEFQVSVEEEGRTRVVDHYQVVAPVSGYLSRVRLEPGNPIASGDALFRIEATPLDPRSRAQANATLSRAEASIQAARTLVEAEQARFELANKELARIEGMVEDGFIPKEQLDRAQTEARRASASLRSAQFSVEVARFERDNAQAALAVTDADSVIHVTAPVDGVLLERLRQSEGPVQAGEPIVTLGDLASLEVIVDVLSPDAVRLRPGMRVELNRWGGEHILDARVKRVEPAGFTRVSALGVEEQRVWVIVDLETPREQWQTLGDGYRVEARFMLWEGDEVLQVPASALFREGDAWATFVIDGDVAVRRTVQPGRRSGLLTEIQEGLEVGEVVVLHPGDNIEDGARVARR